MSTNRIAHLQVDVYTLHRDLQINGPAGVDKDNPLCPYVHRTFILHILHDHYNNISRALQQQLSPEQHSAATQELERTKESITFVETYPQDVLMLNVFFCLDGHQRCV